MPKTSSHPPRQEAGQAQQQVRPGLGRGEMWWDDDPRRPGFGVRSAIRRRRQIVSSSTIGSTGAAPVHHRPVSALVRRRGARAGEGAAQGYRPGQRPGRQEAGAPRGADRPRPDRPLRRGPPAEEVDREDARRRREDDARGDRQAPRQAHEGRRRSRRRHRGDAPQDQRVDRPRRQAPARTSEPHPYGRVEDVLAVAGQGGRDAPWRNAVLGNPCNGVERNHEEGRERFFSQAELASISDALAEYPGVAADCVRLIMLTGCRPAEAMRANGRSSITSLATGSSRARTPSNAKCTSCRSARPRSSCRAAAEERKGMWVFPGDKPGEHLTRCGMSGISSGSAPGLARTPASIICATLSRVSVRAVASAYR